MTIKVATLDKVDLTISAQVVLLGREIEGEVYLKFENHCHMVLILFESYLLTTTSRIHVMVQFQIQKKNIISIHLSKYIIVRLKKPEYVYNKKRANVVHV